MYQSDVLTKEFAIIPGNWSNILSRNFNKNDSPLLLCWQLTAEKTDGRVFQLNGGGSFPETIDVPDTILLDTVVLIDEGIEIDKSKYHINVI